MAWTRRFLGWNKPGIDVAIDLWHREYLRSGRLDLTEHLLIVPTAAARRDVLAALAERARRERFILFPPTVITARNLDAYLLPPECRYANALERELAWERALGVLPLESKEQLLPLVPPEAHAVSLRRLARLVVETEDFLAAELCPFEEVLKHEVIEDSSFHDRWKILAEQRPIYHQYLAEADRCDPLVRRLELLRGEVPAYRGPVWLLATVDLRPISIEIIRVSSNAGTNVVSLILAPEACQEDFDAEGRLVSRRWLKRPLLIPDDHIHWMEQPRDQVLAVWELADGLGCTSADEVTIGIVDSELTPRLVGEGKNLGWKLDVFEPTSASRSLPMTLLRGMADYVAAQGASELALLIRHPDLSSCLAAGSGMTPSEYAQQMATDLDRYRSRRLPLAINLSRLGEEEGLVWADRLESLMRKWRSGKATLAEWVVRFRHALAAVYESEDLTVDLELARDLQEVGDGLAKLEELPASFTDPMPAHEAWSILSRCYGEGRSGEPGDPSAVRGLGWLDLPLDRAPYLIVAGMNEEHFAQKLGLGLLTDSLGESIAGPVGQERHARDRYAWEVILSSRKKVHAIVGRLSADRTPLVPSSLLLSDQTTVRAVRLREFYDGKRVRRRIGWRCPSPVHLRPPILEPAEPIQTLRVTAFRDYLACPYRFYLRHVLKLTSLTDQLDELDRSLFGTLLHEILEAFGRSSIRHSSSADEIQAYLEGEWLDIQRHRFRESITSVAVQGELIKQRLSAFAQWQAQHAAEGWEIATVEFDAMGETAPFDVDRVPFYLTGRVDRVDIHRSTGEVLIIDYKTSDSVVSPEQNHLHREEWIDLQLPLYRHLLVKWLKTYAGSFKGRVTKLGYVHIPKAKDETDLYLAKWDEETLEEADEVARQVVRGLRRGCFEPLSTQPRIARSFPELSRICQDGMLGHE